MMVIKITTVTAANTRALLTPRSGTVLRTLLHLTYISTFNPHNQSVKTVLLLPHFIDEEAEEERSQ